MEKIIVEKLSWKNYHGKIIVEDFIMEKNIVERITKEKIIKECVFHRNYLKTHFCVRFFSTKLFHQLSNNPLG